MTGGCSNKCPRPIVYDEATLKGIQEALSNLPLGDMLVDRHKMSLTVRTEVSPKSNEWGYKLGSVYIRKVHFRDIGPRKAGEAERLGLLHALTQGTDDQDPFAAVPEIARQLRPMSEHAPLSLGNRMRRLAGALSGPAAEG